MPIKELRTNSQIGTDKDPFKKFSIYFTYVFLKLGISAGATMAIGLIVTLIGGLMLVLFNPGIFWIIGGLLIYFSSILDKVNGEIARYHKIDSVDGAYLDGLLDTIRLALIFIFVSWSLFVYTSSSFYLILLSITLFSLYIYSFAEKSTYMLFYKNKKMPKMIAYDDIDLRKDVKGIKKYGIFAIQAFTRYTLLLVATIIAALSANTVLLSLWLLIYTVLFAFGFIVRAYECNKQIKTLKNSR